MILAVYEEVGIWMVMATRPPMKSAVASSDGRAWSQPTRADRRVREENQRPQRSRSDGIASRQTSASGEPEEKVR